MRVNTVNNIKLKIIAKIRETCTCSSSPCAASVPGGSVGSPAQPRLIHLSVRACRLGIEQKMAQTQQIRSIILQNHESTLIVNQKIFEIRDMLYVTILKLYIRYFGKFSRYRSSYVSGYCLFPFLSHTPYRAHPN